MVLPSGTLIVKSMLFKKSVKAGACKSCGCNKNVRPRVSSVRERNDGLLDTIRRAGSTVVLLVIWATRVLICSKRAHAGLNVQTRGRTTIAECAMKRKVNLQEIRIGHVAQRQADNALGEAS